MLRRLSNAIAAGKRAAAKAAPPVASGATEDGEMAGMQVSRALVHFGDAQDLETRLGAHRACCETRGFRCLVISDRIPTGCITARDMIFEFVPWPLQTAYAAPGDFQDALAHSFRRVSLILSSWCVVSCEWANDAALELLELAPKDVHELVRIARNEKRIAFRILSNMVEKI